MRSFKGKIQVKLGRKASGINKVKILSVKK